MSQKKFAVITIDTEADANHQWQKKRPLRYMSVVFGLKEKLIPLFRKHQIKPVYFVAPEILENKEAVQILCSEQKNGLAEIGNHFHSVVKQTGKNYDFETFGCFALGNEDEATQIKLLDERISSLFGKKPVSYRAGRFGADLSTMRTLLRLGYRVDSSVTPHIDWTLKGGPDFINFPEQPYRVSPENFQKEEKSSSLLEVPLTIGKKRFPCLPNNWLSYRWLRPTHMLNFEVSALIEDYLFRYSKSPKLTLCLMFHSMEIIPGATPFVRTSLESRFFLSRLQKMIVTLKKHGFEFKTLTEISAEY